MSSARIFRQVVVVIPVCITAMMNGASYSWVASNMAYLQSKENDVAPYTNQQCTLLAMLLHIGRMFATFFNIFVLSKFGRKSSLIIASSLFLLSSGVILSSKVFLAVVFSRLLSGFGTGVFECFMPIYQGEVVTKNYRGTASSCGMAFYGVGVLLQYMSGIYLTYDDAAIVTVTLSIVMLLSTYCLIESPYFLLTRNPDEALKTIAWLRAVEPKLAEKKLKDMSNQNVPNNGYFFEYFKRPEIYKSFVISLILGCLAAILVSTFISFANFIVPDTKFMTSDKFALLLNVIPIAMSFLSAACIDRVGRRPLLLVGFSLGILLNAIICVLFYIQQRSILKIDNFSWIVFCIIVMFLVVFSLCINPTVGALRTELFPINYKIIGISSSIACNAVAFAMSTIFFMKVTKNYGMYLNFLVYCICCVFGSVFVHCFLPETKGKSLPEIQEILKSNKAVS